MNDDSGFPEISLVFSMTLLLVGLSLDGTAWYVQYTVLAGAVVAAVIGVRSVRNASSS